MMTPSVNDVLYPTAEDRAVAVASLRARIQELYAIRERGILSGGYDGKNATFASVEDLNMAIAKAEGRLMALAVPGYRRPTAGFATFNRGTR